MTMTLATKRHRNQPEDVEATFSMVPVIDEAIGNVGSRAFVPASDVIDLLLDLRLTAAAAELVTSRE
jgi:hypothetical protein